MENISKWPKAVYITGVVLLILGALDPMEGSVVIMLGSILIAIASYKRNDRHKKLFISYALMIITGVFFLFFFSSLGGIGKGSNLSLWWGLLILPYPIAWLAEIITLIVRGFQKKVAV